LKIRLAVVIGLTRIEFQLIPKKQTKLSIEKKISPKRCLHQNLHKTTTPCFHTTMLSKIIAVAAFLGLAADVSAHGYISNPLPRALAIPGHPMRVEPQSDGAQGAQSECNDQGMTGPPEVTWEEGQEVTVEVVVTANHRGFHELRFCEQATGGNACFSQSLATAVSNPTDVPGCPAPAPGGSSHNDCIPSPAESRSLFINDQPHTANYTFTLPEGLTCEHCAMQWWWICANFGGEFFKRYI
jgi:hypothetical protein